MAIHATYVSSRTDVAAIHDIFRSERGPVGQELNRDARLVLNRAQSLTRSRRIRSTGRVESGIGPLGPYRDVTFGRPGFTDFLGYEHDDTPPHDIRPRRRTVLRFMVGGRVVFARRVSHPGTSGSHFLTRALDVLR
jgi:hypothetical protein